MIPLALLGLAGCHSHSHDTHEHEEHEAVKVQYTAYSESFELFAEADPFVIGISANVLCHFSILPGFRALEAGKVSLVLTIEGKETRQALEQPTRKGIYSFDITPVQAGEGTLRFEIEHKEGRFEVNAGQVRVFADEHTAEEAAGQQSVSHTNATIFTKEQSWKVDFATGFPRTEAFGQAIRTSALVSFPPADEQVVTASAPGIVRYGQANLVSGMEVVKGQTLFTLSSGELSDNNFTVRLAEARSEYLNAKAEHERAVVLAADRIIAQKDLQAAQNRYERTRAVYENLDKNTGEQGRRVSSPISGYIGQVFVRNGAYVEAGQAVLNVALSKDVLLLAEVPTRYASVLKDITSATIRSQNGEAAYSLEELGGRIVAVGRSAGPENFLIPVTLSLANTAGFVPGEFVEIYLKATTSEKALTVPVTALLEEQGLFFVWVQITPELFEKREVKVGSSDGRRIEIVRGLASDERIVTEGAVMVRLAQATGTLDAHSGHVH